MERMKNKFNVDVVTELTKKLLDCNVDALIVERDGDDFTLTIPSELHDWQIKKIMEILQNYPFLVFSFVHDTGLMIFEDGN
jgi:hypothetical protein